MNFLEQMPRCVFFTGKGGVGKTSLACATAVQLADRGLRVLLVSTDPASNVGQVFSQTIGNTLQAIAAVPGLWGLEIDPQAAAQGYRNRILTPARASLSAEQLRGMEEQLSGACTTEIAAFDEFTGLLTDPDLQARFDHIVFDTAPTGHTIRLLQLPGAWSEFLAAGQGDASCLGPLAGLERQRQQYQAAVAALADPQQTRLVLVARAQATALREVERTRHELAQVGLHQPCLVINGLMPATEAPIDPLAAAILAREEAALAALPPALQALSQDRVPLLAHDLVGLPALRALLATPGTVSAALPLIDLPADLEASAPDTPVRWPDLASLLDEIAAPGHGLIMLMGKGGVGKTTVAAAIAVALAQRGLPVHLSSTDPAARLADTLMGELPHLRVSHIDPHAETERYRAQVMASKGKGLDAQALALLEEDLRSPCTEEIAVFQAFSRLIREGGRQFVVMDTAPTGHTLLLLDATGAYHRDIARQMGPATATGARFTTPMMQLQDPARTKVLIVTLAENTPVQESAALQADLQRAGIQPWAWVVNNSLAPLSPQSPLLQRRATKERALLPTIQAQHAGRLALVPLQAREPTGPDGLLALCQV